MFEKSGFRLIYEVSAFNSACMEWTESYSPVAEGVIPPSKISALQDFSLSGSSSFAFCRFKSASCWMRSSSISTRLVCMLAQSARMLPFAFGSSEMLIVAAFRRGRAGEANITLTLSGRLCHPEKHSAFGDYPDLVCADRWHRRKPRIRKWRLLKALPLRSTDGARE